MPSAKKAASLYQLRVDLDWIRPPIWRRLLIPSNATLEQLHGAIQIAFGWHNCHMHHFFTQGKDVRDTRYFSQPEFLDNYSDDLGGLVPVPKPGDETKTRLDEVLEKEKAAIFYEYDFGDSWLHRVLLEKILEIDPKASYPVCAKGKRACPPENCGSFPGYEELLETLAGPETAEKEEMLEWLGGGFDPEAFDLKETNKRLKAGRFKF